MARFTAVFGVIAAVALGGCPEPRPVGPADHDGSEHGTRGPRKTSAFTAEESVPLIPRPTAVDTCAQPFDLDEDVVIVANDAAMPVAKLLASWVGRRVGTKSDHPVIELRLEGSTHRDPAERPPSRADQERWWLDIAATGVTVRSRDLGGLFQGAQALAQIAGVRRIDEPSTPIKKAPRTSLPCMRLENVPRFPIRAMHLDVVRHFFDAATVERYIDIIAFYNFNVFHWHLTDDQGFRVPLHDLATEPHYAREEIARVIAYARVRGITVVPEIEMPGHARAILSKRPELSCEGKPLPLPAEQWGVFPDILCAGNPETTKLIDALLAEVATMFPSKLIHVGGDEAPKDRWNACPKCRAAMEHDHLDAKGLEKKLFTHVAETLAKQGKRMLAWDDALDAIPADGIAVAWQNAARGADAARKGHDVILAPSETTYFNFWQSKTKTEPGHEGFIPWTAVLDFDPVPKDLTEEQRAHVLGGEGALWTEYVKTKWDLDTLLLPRLAALAETLGGARDPRTFPARLTAQRRMLFGLNYFVEPPAGMPTHRAFLDTATVGLEAPRLWTDAEVWYTTDGSEPNVASPDFFGLTLHQTTTVKARTSLGGGRVSAVVRGDFERQSPRPAESTTTTATTATTVPGLDFDYVEGSFTAVPSDFTAAKVHGHLDGLGFDPRFREKNFAVRYRGLVQAKTTGITTLTVKSDDGVIVEIGGKQVLADDGAHAPREVSDTVALEAGWHPITIRYFQGGGGKSIALACNGAPCTFATAK